MDTETRKGSACRLVCTGTGGATSQSEQQHGEREHTLRHERTGDITCYTALALLTVFGGLGLAVPLYGEWGWVMTGAGVLGCVALLFDMARQDADLNLLEAKPGASAPRAFKKPAARHGMKTVPHATMQHPLPSVHHHGTWHMAAVPVMSRARPVENVKRWPYRRLAH